MPWTVYTDCSNNFVKFENIQYSVYWEFDRKSLLFKNFPLKS